MIPRNPAIAKCGIRRNGWKHCISHQIFHYLEKGWQDANIFWGLIPANIRKIHALQKEGKDWWYIDCGYITEQCTRYPIPHIHDLDRTYFRICKNSIHTTNLKPSDGSRRKILEEKYILNPGVPEKREGNKILICPSSETVTQQHLRISQDIWIQSVVGQIRNDPELKDKEIVIRQKPRPNNKFWGTEIQDILNDDVGLCVTALSLSAVDAILEGVPVVTHNQNVAYPLSAKDPEHRFRPVWSDPTEWINSIADNQFTLEEMENGTAWEILNS